MNLGDEPMRYLVFAAGSVSRHGERFLVRLPLPDEVRDS
jgi:hypothetical protein